MIDWNGAVLEQFEESHISPSSRSLLYPGVPNADRLHRVARFHELSKCVQISRLTDGNPIPGFFSIINFYQFIFLFLGTCSLFQFNMWKNGNVEVDELQARLKMCVQQVV